MASPSLVNLNDREGKSPSGCEGVHSDSDQLKFITKLLSDIKLYNSIEDNLVPFDRLQSFSTSIPSEIDDKRDPSPILRFLNSKALKAEAKASRMSSRRNREMGFLSRADFIFETLQSYLPSVNSHVQLRL